MNRGLVALFVVPVVAAAALPLKAQVITSIERRNPNVASAAAFVRIAPGPLMEGAAAYADRAHLYRNVPPALVGAQYIIMAMEDKDNPNLELHITIGQPGTLYLILDNRVGTNLRSPTATPNPLMAGMGWVTVMGFADTGLDMAVDELADGTIDNYYSVFSIPVTPGEVILRAQNDRLYARDRNMYGVAATSAIGKASNPTPANGQQMVVETQLAWAPGAMAVMHNVYLGTTPRLGPADLVGPQLHTAVFDCAQVLTPGVTYYWRVDEIGADTVTIVTGDVWSFTTASVIAFDPVPMDGTAAVDPGLTLSWKAAPDAVGHDLYLGKDKAAVERGDPSTFQGTVSATTWTPAALEPGTTYFWRIDEVAADGAKSRPRLVVRHNGRHRER